MKKSLLKKRYVILLAVLIFLILGLYNKIQVTNYKLSSEKILGQVKIGLVSDTHSCKYKYDQQEIYKLLEKEGVDLIFLTGDIIDDKLPMDQGFKTIKSFKNLAPTYYVTGNHEHWSGQVDFIKEKMIAIGITVLSGEVEEIEIKGNKLKVMGIDDPFVGEEYYSQLENLAGETSTDLKLLLAHRPEKLEDYKKTKADLIFSGHAHGGQWRLPLFLEGGLFAPNQGFFPRLTNDVVEINKGQRLIISRGLSRESTKIPRFYNRPELVIVTIEGNKE